MSTRNKNIKRRMTNALVNCLIALLLVTILLCCVAPANLQLLALSFERSLIVEDASNRGWTPKITAAWDENVEKLAEVAKSSAYADFMVKASQWVEIAIVLLEIAVIVLLLVWACKNGKYFISQIKKLASR